MNPRPAPDAAIGSLHWLYRPTGEPHWMVAIWDGERWQTNHGRWLPQDLVWWNYSAPAAPPTSHEADHRKNAMLECRKLIQDAAESYVHEFFIYDPSTGVWEPGNEETQIHDDAMSEALALIDAKIRAEFGSPPETAP